MAPDQTTAFADLVQQRDLLAWTLGIVFTLSLGIKVLVYLLWQQRKRLIADLTKNKEELEELNSNRSKLISIIAHDLKGPLANYGKLPHVVRYMVENQQYSQLEELSNLIDKSVFEINSMVDSLLNWAMVQNHDIQPSFAKAQLGKIVNRTKDLYFQALQAKNINFEIEVDEGLFVDTDHELLFIATRNIVSNAIKFSLPGATIRVTAAYGAQGNVMLTIQDSGLGMSDKQLEQLFKPDRSKRRSGTAGEMGSGLGMLLIKDILKMLNSDIQVTSTVNQGTKVTILIPSEQVEQVQKSGSMLAVA